MREAAEESRQAAATISRIVQQIQSETRVAVAVVEDGAARTGVSAATARQTRVAFERIGDAVGEEVAASAEMLARSAEELKALVGVFRLGASAE